MPTPSETLPDILTEMIDVRGMPAEMIGGALGVSGMAVHYWRQNRSVPNAKTWPRLAKLSGRTVEDIACAIARGVKRLPARPSRATTSK